MQLAKLRQGEGKAARDPTSKHHFQYYEEEEEEEEEDGDGGVTKCNFSNATLDFKLVRSDTFFGLLVIYTTCFPLSEDLRILKS